MEKQISAVEWLENEFKEICKDFGGLHTDFIERFDIAKAKERVQKAEEYLKGFKDGKEYQIKLDELTFNSEIITDINLDENDIKKINDYVKNETFKSE